MTEINVVVFQDYNPQPAKHPMSIDRQKKRYCWTLAHLVKNPEEAVTGHTMPNGSCEEDIP